LKPQACEGVSVARTHGKISLLRMLCERFNAYLENLNKEGVEELFSSVEIAYRPNTVNEFKKALKYFLKFQGKNDLASMIKGKEVKDNELKREDLLAVDEVLKLVSVAMNKRDPVLIICHLDLACRPEVVLTLTVGDFVRDALGIRVEIRRSKTFRRLPHLSFSLPYVSCWLNIHPLKDEQMYRCG